MAHLEWLKRMFALMKRRDAAKSPPPAPESGRASESCGGKLIIAEAEKHERTGKLTPRERELCLFLVEGYTLKESAERLHVKYSTANTHMNGVYRKLGVNSRAELIINYRYLVSASSGGGAAAGV